MLRRMESGVTLRGSGIVRFGRPSLSTAMMLMACLAVTAPYRLYAQHASVTTGDPSADTCLLCHGSHDSGYNQATLKSGGVPDVAMDAPGIGPASQSCLRCHVTPSVRAVQPEFQESAPATTTSRFLELDLTDDHPLGRFDIARLKDRNRESPISATEASRMRPLMFGSEDGAVLECTGCHDPHDRRGPLPSIEEERTLCTNCHDAARYAFGGVHTELPCSGCHLMHGGFDRELLAEPDPDRICVSCHEQTGPTVAAGNASPAALRRVQIFTMIVPPTSQAHLDPPDGSCVDCHSPHEPSRY